MKIFKFTLNGTSKQVITVPSDSQFLTVQIQHGKPQLWIVIGKSDVYKEFIIHIVVTGMDYPLDGLKYISTYQLAGGHFIAHVFVEG